MEIQSINSIININNTQAKTGSVQNNEFKELFDKITGGDLAQEMRDTYDVTLNVGSIGNVTDFLNTHDIRCKNFVAISTDTLSKMEENPALKKKVMSAIEEFCSPKAQAEINALAPPVKSAGMIVYPDGDTLYWLEGYSNEIGNEKDKKIVNEKSISESFQKYSDTDYQVTENNLEAIMQIMAAEYERKIENEC
ncbi:MAG: hypothetical protein J6C00_10315 [Eubacterium sp.]|nr:hypothetical protein [Eubacterium sp.]